jgi:methylmalonyl-CoA/ethylmalonyl-CoA epimerase
MDLKIHHVGIVQPSLEDALAFMSLLGLAEDFRGYVERWQCWCIFTKATGTTTIELVVPEGGPLAKFNKGAGGLHHVALEVDSLDEVRLRLEEQGLRLLEPNPVKGAGNFLCNFLSPVSTRGIQLEFIQVLGANTQVSEL